MKLSVALFAAAQANPTEWMVNQWWEQAVQVFNFSANNWSSFAAAVNSVDDSQWQPLWQFCNADGSDALSSDELTSCGARAANYLGMPQAHQNFLYEFAGKYWSVIDQDGSGDLSYDEYRYTFGAKRTGSYATCKPTGNNIISDTINGYLMSMDKSVDIFAEKIKADPKLAGGFNAIGFSQGNSLIRGYIHKYNDPPVNTFISVHGTVMGVAAFPGCFEQGKTLGLICKAFAELLGDLAYNPIVQNILFQAGYYRAADKTTGAAYKKNSQIAQWNNEGAVNATYKTNFQSVKKFAMVKAMKDSMVFPNEGEHWGAEPDGTYGPAKDMKDTKFYTQDLFGLKEVDAAGKIFYETTPGDHLQFTNEQLNGWVDKYFLGKSADVVV